MIELDDNYKYKVGKQVSPVVPTATEPTHAINKQQAEEIAAAGGGGGLYNVETYGAVHDGATDDTLAIQDAIDAAFAAGGGKVYFPKGVYIIAGALRNDVGAGLVDYNSQLIIPQTNLNDPDRPSIELVGEVQPNLFQALGIGNYTVPNSGVILRSTIQGSGVEPSVIANKGAATNFNGISYTSAQFKNLSIQVTPDANSKVTMGGINCADSAIANFEYVTVYPHNQDLVLSGEPNVINVTGISMPKIATEHINTIDKCTVGGFTNGYKVGEHSHVINAVAIACVNGFLITENHHTPVLDKIECNWCKYDIGIDTATKAYTSSGYYVKIDNMLTEWKNQGVWYDNTATLNDPLDRGTGSICFDTVEANVGLNNNRFKKIGGSNVRAVPMSIDISTPITTASYTLKYTDAFRKNKCASASDQSATVPLDMSWDNDQEITLRRQGAGRVSITAATGITINVPTGFTAEIRDRYDAVTLVKNSANNYTLYGALKPTT